MLADHSVRMASLSCFSALLNIQDGIPAVLEWMVCANNAKSFIEVAHVTILCGTVSLSKRSFVEELLLIASRPDDSFRTLLRLEAMSLLSKIAKNYSSALRCDPVVASVLVAWSAQKLTSFVVLAAQHKLETTRRLHAVGVPRLGPKRSSPSRQDLGELHQRRERKPSGEPSVPRRLNRVVSDRAHRGVTWNQSRTSINQSLAVQCAGETTCLMAIGICTDTVHFFVLQHVSALSRKECLDFMATHLIRAFRDTSHHVRASVCACFTLLRPNDWTQLREKQSRLPALARAGVSSHSLDMYTNIFLQTPKDSSPVVRAAGFRLLGSLCLAPVFKTREFASAVVSLALESLGDSTLNVRVRGAWALGNVCTTQGPEAFGSDDDALHPSHEAGQLLLYELLPAYQMRHIVEKMLVCINDNDKVASSVARTLGLVCRWVCFEPFVKTISSKERSVLDDLLGQTMVVLATKINAGSPKVRWNACHAIAKVLLCPGLPLASVTWAPSVFHALVSAISQQENFKVRISAASALRVSGYRSGYGAFFKTALRATIDALETASDLKDVTEFKYKEQLETQLSFTLVHLIQVATEEDDALIWEVLREKPPGFLYDWLFHNLHRMCSAIERDSEQGSASNNYGMDDAHAEDGGGAGGGAGGGEVHDVNPIKKEEILSAVGSLLRILQREDAQKLNSSACISILYDAKLSLERDVLYSSDDVLGFEL